MVRFSAVNLNFVDSISVFLDSMVSILVDFKISQYFVTCSDQ